MSLLVPRAMRMMTLASPTISRQLVTAMRPAINRTLVGVSPAPRGTSTRPMTATVYGSRHGQVRGEWVFGPGVRRPADAAAASIIYYLHGSGYIICSPRTHRGLVARLSRRTGRAAFSLDYRLGPRYHLPAGGDDTIRGYHWLLDAGHRAENIVVAGDSAGGHLALDLLADNHRTGTPQPGGLALFSPLLDPTFDIAARCERDGVRDPYISAIAAQRFLSLYTDIAEVADPRVTIPISSGMTLPPTLIQVGGREVMGDDAREMHRQLTAAGGHCQLQVWPDQGHVFQMFPYLTPESERAVAEAGRFIRSLD